MRYLLLALPALAALPLAAATPLPAAAPPPPLFPMTIGTKWEYSGAAIESRAEITAARVRNGVAVVTIERTVLNAPRDTTYCKVEVSERGVFEVESNYLRLDPPRCWLRAGAKPDATWGHSFARDGSSWVRQRAAERVTVPAGTYHAVPVDDLFQPFEANDRGEIPTHRFTHWFAPGVGHVKSGTDGIEFLLLSFTPGRHSR